MKKYLLIFFILFVSCDDGFDALFEVRTDFGYVCENITCIHGKCQNKDVGIGRCECDIGYIGERCDLCDLGYHYEGDACVSDKSCGNSTECDNGRVCWEEFCRKTALKDEICSHYNYSAPCEDGLVCLPGEYDAFCRRQSNIIAKENELCYDNKIAYSALCEGDLYCWGSDDNGFYCRVAVGEGESCGNNKACEDGYSCIDEICVKEFVGNMEVAKKDELCGKYDSNGNELYNAICMDNLTCFGNENYGGYYCRETALKNELCRKEINDEKIYYAPCVDGLSCEGNEEYGYYCQ